MPATHEPEFAGISGGPENPRGRPYTRPTPPSIPARSRANAIGSARLPAESLFTPFPGVTRIGLPARRPRHHGGTLRLPAASSLPAAFPAATSMGHPAPEPAVVAGPVRLPAASSLYAALRAAAWMGVPAPGPAVAAGPVRLPAASSVPVRLHAASSLRLRRPAGSSLSANDPCGLASTPVRGRDTAGAIRHRPVPRCAGLSKDHAGGKGWANRPGHRGSLLLKKRANPSTPRTGRSRSDCGTPAVNGSPLVR
jgi:hypothetical protein